MIRIAIANQKGGVGKTTSSALLAIRAAMSGRRVALLSIDAAKRLASALGLGLGAALRQDALLAWRDYQATGLHVPAAAADEWLARLERGDEVAPPAPQR